MVALPRLARQGSFRIEGRAGRTSPLQSVALLAGCDRAADEHAAVSDIAVAVPVASPASGVPHPLCPLAWFEEAQAVGGAHLPNVEVIDVPLLRNVDCVDLDPPDPYDTLSLRFTSTGRLEASGPQWASAAAYAAGCGRSGTTVSGLGESAAWIELPAGLPVHRGKYALHLGTSRADVSQPGVRSRFGTLAQQVLARLPWALRR